MTPVLWASQLQLEYKPAPQTLVYSVLKSPQSTILIIRPPPHIFLKVTSGLPKSFEVLKKDSPRPGQAPTVDEINPVIRIIRIYTISPIV